MADNELGFSVNRLILGDNLEILPQIPDECIDLIYLDPPFFSNRNYEVIWGDAGEIRSFQDRWAGGIDHYIGWLYERVEQMHRVLKPTGSLYLHCDWHADAYIRALILDKLFGEKNFRNEIVWGYQWGGVGKRNFARKHDSIYWYSKDKTKWIFNEKEMREPYKTKDTRWHNHEEGKLLRDIWDDIPIINTMSAERIGYPTQKPEALMERIIKASSNKGDIVLDPFMGGGTTIAVADKLGRQWIGIDQSTMAIKVTEFRLEKQSGALEGHAALFTAPYIVQLYKYDKDILFNEDPFKFETRIIGLFGGVPQDKKGGDKGVDGKTKNGTPIQVKQQEKIGVNVVKNFFVSAEQFNKYRFDKNVAEKKPAGFIIAFSFSKGAIEEAARLKNTKNVIIKLVTVEEIIPLSVKPIIAVHINELEKNNDGSRKIECVAAGNSPAGIEFYSWDFNYDIEKNKFKPSVMIDKEGKQVISLPTGTHNIACKVVDNDGLENIEVIKLKINGGVKRE